MEFTLWGFDVYTPEVDDKGIDFIARRGLGSFLEIQVKSVRTKGYVFMRKAHFVPRDGLFLALVVFTPGRTPDAFLIESTVWLEPNRLFVSRDYEGLASTPEWGLNVTAANLERLAPYAFDLALSRLVSSALL